MDKLIITLRPEKTVTLTVQIDQSIQEQFNELVEKTKRPRNELINIMLRFALNRIEID